VKVREAIDLIEADGWGAGCHARQPSAIQAPHEPGRVTIAGKPSHDLAPGTLNSILKQAEQKEQP